MSISLKNNLKRLLLFSLLMIGNLFILSNIFSVKAETVYRVNNFSSGEHLHTTSSLEVQTLVCNGWTDEGICWISPDSGEGVYRVYNPAYPGGDHLYTTDTNEVRVLTTERGWQSDNNGQPIFYSAGSIPVYRLFNSTTGRHHLTTDANEYNVLGSSGWNQEGISLSCQEGAENYLSPSVVKNSILNLQNSYPEGMNWTNDDYYESRADGYITFGGYGCHAFALICSDTAFNTLPMRIHNNKNDIKVGDIVRIPGHSVVVLDACGDNITITEGNYSGKIHWNRQLSRASLNVQYIMTRYPGYNEPSDESLLDL